MLKKSFVIVKRFFLNAENRFMLYKQVSPNIYTSGSIPAALLVSFSIFPYMTGLTTNSDLFSLLYD